MFVFGALSLIGAMFSSVLFGVLAGVAGMSGEPDAAVGGAFLGLTGAILSVLLVLYGLPAVIAGWGLLKFRPWGRILAIVVAAVSLTSFPLGTAFGIYALIILFRKDTEALFSGPVTAA